MGRSLAGLVAHLAFFPETFFWPDGDLETARRAVSDTDSYNCARWRCDHSTAPDVAFSRRGHATRMDGRESGRTTTTANPSIHTNSSAARHRLLIAIAMHRMLSFEIFL
eukprot:440575-Prymnesium_polylepis.1